MQILSVRGRLRITQNDTTRIYDLTLILSLGCLWSYQTFLTSRYRHRPVQWEWGQTIPRWVTSPNTIYYPPLTRLRLFIMHLHGQTGRFAVCATNNQIQDQWISTGIASTICTNQFLSPKNSLEGLKLVSKMRFYKCNSVLKPLPPFQMFPCSWKFSAGTTQKVVLTFIYFLTRFPRNFLWMVNNQKFQARCPYTQSHNLWIQR